MEYSCIHYINDSRIFSRYICHIKERALDGAWSFLFSIPLITVAFVFGVRRWNKKLRDFSETQYLLTACGLIQKSKNNASKEFKYSEIAVIQKIKFGTNIVKGDWWRKMDYYYRPKNIGIQLDDPELIFIPSITSNYSELIEEIKSHRKRKNTDH